MTDALAAPREGSAGAGRPTAGSLLRAARERQGLHVAALAASVKVAPRKVEALEADRYDELPDLTFARGLARTICRVLAIDAAPVLALLPQLPNVGLGLEQVHNGLNMPLRSGRLPGSDADLLKRPVVWLALLLLLAALIVWLLPQSWIARTRGGAGRAAPVAASAAAPASAGAAAGASAAAAGVSADVPSVAGASAPAALSEPAPLLQLQARGDAWVEVLDARGAIVIRRRVRAGESVALDGTPPLRMRIRNASALALAFRGRPVELARTRDDTVRLELK